MLLRLAAISAVLVAVEISPAAAEPSTSITAEPLFLVLPMVSITAEQEVVSHVGIAAIGGYGHPLVASMYQLGGELNYYVQRPFTGLHVGAELQYLWGASSLEPLAGSSKSSSGVVRVAGAYGGYKWCASYGLTAVLELGVGHYDAPDVSEWNPVANLTAGWSW